jgi:hypothetical protein
MTEPNEIFAIAAAVALVIALPATVIAWFRIVRAKTSTEYFKNILLFVLPILAVFVLADMAGLVEFPPAMPKEPVEAPRPSEIFSQLSLLQLILLGAAAVVWIAGGNILMLAHLRRTGKRWWVLLNPFRPPFGEFSSKEWSILGGLLVASMVLGIAALNV